MIALQNYDTDSSEGERLKLKAFSLLEVRRQALIRRARRALLAVLIDRGEATADDVWAVVTVPQGINPKLFGAVPGELAALGIITAEGYAKSARREAHARPVQVWLLADSDAAVRWLLEHPELPEPNLVTEDSCDLSTNSPNKKPGASTPGN
jgi:hypothetical protein